MNKNDSLLSGSRGKWLLSLALFVITFATFLSVIDAGFVDWDDNLNITGNPHIQKLDAESLKWMFTDTTLMRRYVPIAWLNWGTLCHLFGLNPRAFHLEALLLHSLNTILIFFLIRQILLTCSSRRESALTSLEENSAAPNPPINLCAALGTLLWAVHPLRVETVAWANCQMYPQSLFFLLLSLFFYLRAINNDSSSLKSGSLWISAILYTCSLLTYPTGIAYVIVLLALDLIVLKRFSLSDWKNPSTRIALVDKIPFVVATLVVAAVTLWARATMTGMWTITGQTQNFGIIDRAAQAFYIWAYFLWKPLFPWNLSPVYTTLVSFTPLSWPFLLSATAIIGITVILLLRRKCWPGITALWVCYLALLVPMLGLTEHPHYPNDRYNYIAAILFSIAISFGLIKIWNHRIAPTSLLALSVVAAAAFSLLSVQQTRIWKNSETLFKGIIAHLGTDNYRTDIYWRLGLYYANTNQPTAALESFSQALKIFPKFTQAHNDMAAILVQENKLDEATTHYEAVLKYSPTNAASHKGLAFLLSKQGKIQEAADHYATAIKSDPSDTKARLNLVAMLAQLGQTSEAFDQVFIAVKNDPQSPEAQFFAGNACMNLQKVPEGIEHFQAAVKLKPDYTEAHFNLGNALASTGKISDALPHFLETVKLDPTRPEGYLACARALSATGQKEEALQKYKAAQHLAQTSGRTDLAAQIQSEIQSLKP